MKLFFALLFALSTLVGFTSQAAAQSWEYEENRDELTDEDNGLAYYSHGGMEFGAFCVQDTPVFLASVPDYIGSDSMDNIPGAYRIRGDNDTGVISYRFQTVSDGSGFRFRLSDGPDLVGPIAEGSEIVLRVQDFRDRTNTYTVPLTGSREALEHLDCVDFSEEESQPTSEAEDGENSAEDAQQGTWEITENGEVYRLDESGEGIAFTCDPRAMGFTIDEPIDTASNGEFVVAFKFETDGDSEVAAYIFGYDRERSTTVLVDTDDIDGLSASMIEHDQMTMSFHTTNRELEQLTLDLEGFEQAFEKASCF